MVTRHSLSGYVPSPILVWEPRLDGSDPLVGGPWPADRGDDIEVEVVVDGVVVDGAVHRFPYRVSVMGPVPDGSVPGLLIDAALRTTGRAAALLTSVVPPAFG